MITDKVRVLSVQRPNNRCCHVCGRRGIDKQLASNGGKLFVGLCNDCIYSLAVAIDGDLDRKVNEK